MNPYVEFVSGFAGLVNQGKSLPLGGIAPKVRTRPSSDAPVAMILSPHPDDECVIGGLALRLLREAGMRVVNVAVTQGSNPQRQEGRLRELAAACDYLGFELKQTAPRGLEKIAPKTRAQDPAHWAACVRVIADILATSKPGVIFFPHASDFNGTHIGTHYLVMDALRQLPTSFTCTLVETEFWAQMTGPNLMVESSAEDVADMLAALSFHVGEVQRNPYHLRLPGWLQDNVRRGAEVVGGQGGAAPDYLFATLYRLRQWRDGKATDLYAGGRCVGTGDDVRTALGL
jgi:N-acetylglucosamine malate deacetylase 1